MMLMKRRKETTMTTTATKKKSKPAGPAVNGGSREARRLAAAIMEVLAGEKTPYEAADALGISPPRYYALELRALQGMLTACEPRDGRRKSSPERKIKSLQDEVGQLKRDCARQQALLRAARRSVGLPSETKPKSRDKGKRRRKRGPRAMRVVAMLRQPREEKPHVGPAAGPA
jgi:hypothetical protein